MGELVFILTDFYSATPSEQAARVAEAPPRLPALELLLARSRSRILAEGWRGWLASRAGARELAPAELVARVLGQEAPAPASAAPAVAAPAPGRWLATPVHLFAGLDSVHVHPAGLLWLSDAEQQALAAQFAQVFADSPWRLQALGQRELLLRGPALQASGADPAAVLGGDPSAAMPRGSDASALRRLGSEIELWLFEHPLNRQRQERGELPITTLWLWGARSDAPAVPTHAPRELAPRLGHDGLREARLYGRDTYAEALWRWQGACSEPLPAATAATAATAPFERGARSVVLYPLAGAGPLAPCLQQLERQWLLPAVTALRAGRIRQLWLLTGTHAYRLRWSDLARVWRARRPWWQHLQ